MGFNLSAFGGGFASAAVEDIQKERKLAELRGTEAVKSLYTNYKTVIEENKKKETDLLGNIDLLRTYDPTASEAELYALSTKPVVMNQITSLIKDKAFDPASFKLSNFVKVAEDNVEATAVERVKMLSVLPNAAKATIIEQQKSGNFFKDMVSSSSSKAKEKAMLEQAQAMGIPLERLRAAQDFVRPAANVNATVDMSKLRPEKTFSDLEAQAKIESLKARDANDPAAIAAATKKLANIVAVNAEASLAGKSEAQIQSDMITNIQRLTKEGKPQEAAVEQALLVQRQTLASKPEKAGKTDADKISQANMIQVASRLVNAVVADQLTPGSFNTVTDRDGNVTTELKEFRQSAAYDAAVASARQQAIDRFTTNGKPKGEMQYNALASIGVQFKDGIAFVPKVVRAATETSKPAASGSGRLGSAPSGRNAAPAPAAAPAAAPRPTTAPALVWDIKTNSWVTP